MSSFIGLSRLQQSNAPGGGAQRDQTSGGGGHSLHCHQVLIMGQSCKIKNNSNCPDKGLKMRIQS